MDSSCSSLGISFHFTAMSPTAITTNAIRYNSNCPDKPRSVNECTEALPKIPERDRKVEYRISKNCAMVRITADFKPAELRFAVSIVCKDAIMINQGTYTAF